MANELNEMILALVQASGISDYDQRSAMGIARSWVETGNPIKRQTYLVEQFKGRDDLAEALMLALGESDKKSAWTRLATQEMLSICRLWIRR